MMNRNGWIGILAVLIGTGALASERKPDPVVFADKAGLKSWVQQTRKCCTEDRPAFEQRLRAVDPSFSPPSGETAGELPLARAEVFFGQLDADKDEEAVVQYVHHGAFEGNGWRAEVFWVGVFDKTKRGYELAGALRPEVWHCNWDEKTLGLTFRFAGKKPAEAMLEVRKQETDSCGTRISFTVVVEAYALTGGKLERKSERTGPGEDYDRLQPQ
jgi:hypothetical protein